MLVHEYEKNTEGQDFFVGDIHGMYNLLMSQLNLLGFDRNVDRLFSVGDIVDRGIVLKYSYRTMKRTT